MSTPEPLYFATPAEFRDWLKAHAATSASLVVGFHKRDSGVPSMTWPEAVDEALCAGWIDGVRKRVDDARYQIRFTPRKPSSNWSAINIERMRVLEAAGRVTPAGHAAFACRIEARSRIYAYEQADAAALSAEDERVFRADAKAWAFLQKQPPGYLRRVLWHVVSAKQEATRKKRLAALIAASARHERL